MKTINNIHLASREQCSGCAACSSICPTNSITMREDKEGFLQPHIDVDNCIKCHKCEKTCPIISPISVPTDFETHAFAAINKDEAVRMRSSSGGMFHAIAKWTIKHGGVVFGAKFDDKWEVVHDYTETIKGIEPFLRSKYVQSRIGDTYRKAMEFLKEGRQVLFVGTPCQIGGLHAYLGKDYENLLLVDFICHGVPSPSVWRKYLKEKVQEDKVLDINFRDKRIGWKDFQCVTTTTTTTTCEKQLENKYFRGFLSDIYLRRSCYDCQYRGIHRISDITLADFWGVENVSPEIHDDKGTSLVCCHSTKGHRMFQTLEAEFKIAPQSIDTVVPHNMAMVRNYKMPSRRNWFFRAFRLTNSFNMASRYIDKDIFMKRLVRKIKKFLVR